MDATAIIISNIKDLIASKGLKQKAIAEKSGFTPRSFSDLMNGRKRLGAEHIPAIANALGVTPNDIFRQKSN